MSDDALARRTVRVLAGSQVLGGVGVGSGIAVGGVLARDVSGSTALSGLAQTAAVLGAALAALPMARIMSARGRRPGLTLGYAAGALGAVLFVVGALVSSFAVILAGATLFGGGTAAGLQARYAATDLAVPARRGTALSTVVWSTTVGAVLGPNLIGPGGRLGAALGLPELAGPFLFSFAAFVSAAAVVALLLRPDPLLEARRRAGTGHVVPPRRSVRQNLWVVRRHPRALLGLAAVVSAHTVMVAVMVMTPVHMSQGGAQLRVIGLVISVHIAGMYALSPVMGKLADRLGRLPVIVGGQGLLLLAVLVAGGAPSHAHVRLGLGLMLLGLGWSAALVAGSTLLSESVPEGVRPAVQGSADFVMGVCAAAAGALSGVALEVLGYGGLNAAAALFVVPVLVLALRGGAPGDGAAGAAGAASGLGRKGSSSYAHRPRARRR